LQIYLKITKKEYALYLFIYILYKFAKEYHYFSNYVKTNYSMKKNNIFTNAIIVLFLNLFFCPIHSIIAIGYNTRNHPDSVYTFAYHYGDPHSGLRIAYSIDNRYWIPLGNDYSFVKSDFGSWGPFKTMYNPSTLYDNGTWYVVWSVANNINQFATTKSEDFWIWKPQSYPYLYNSNSLINPILRKKGKKFELYYKTNDNNYYVVFSDDFNNWSDSRQINAETYDSVSNLKSIIINGKEYEGNINKVPYSTINKLIINVDNSQTRNALFNESCRDDINRFKNIESISGVLDLTSNIKPISSNLIGIFFEDINYSADGGLYAELIQNRDFEYNEMDRKEWNAKSFWETDSSTEFEISEDNPIHTNNKHYAVISSPYGLATLSNNGFDGIVLKKGEKYEFSIFVKSISKGKYNIKVKLIDGDKVLAQSLLKVKTVEWKQQKTVLMPNSDSRNATLQLEIQGKGKIGLDFISLFPQNTFKSRPNGLRQDLAQVLADIHPKFIRFPGGCVTHGNGLENMYNWKETIGPLWERKSQFNLWGYHQSKGLGFYEFFQFCEDIGAEPLPVLPAGVCCQNSSIGGHGQQGGIPMDEMDDYTQDLLDLIEWANGDPSTSKWAKIRAESGHEQPFNLKMIGIGNEDLISDVFVERFKYINKTIKEHYPEIQVVGTVGPFFEGSDYEYGWQLAKDENIDIVDEHYYVNPGWYIHNQDYYDTYDRNGTKVYLGEWASRSNELENALAESMHILNIERNADVVIMTSYAPLLAKIGHTQWNPDLIYFNNSEVLPTVNYYIQQLCGTNSGNNYIYSNLQIETKDLNGNLITSDNNPVQKRIKQSVVLDNSSGDLIIKLVNITPIPATLKIILNRYNNYKTVFLSTLAGEYNEKNIKPTYKSIDINDLHQLIIPSYSFTVLRLTNN